jgi:hypothetical protein
MLFEERVAKKKSEESRTEMVELQVDQATGRILLRKTVLHNGLESYVCTVSANVSDFDPQLVCVTEPDSEDEQYLEAVCSLYRPAVELIQSASGLKVRSEWSVRLHIPLVAQLSDTERVVESFRDFIRSCGAKSPLIVPGELKDLLAPLNEALKSATGVKYGVYEQIVSLDETNLILVKEERRTEVSALWKYELLSLDPGSSLTCWRDTPRTISSTGEVVYLWRVGLFGVQSIYSTIWHDEYGNIEPWNSTHILFPSQHDGEHFANVCTHCVPQLRERLYLANYDS